MVFSRLLLLLLSAACSMSLIAANQKEWTLEEFKKNVIEDDRVWIVEFYSGMCGSCKEFAPTWERIEMSLNDVLKTKVNIDQKGGMEVAQYMGALEEGLPNVRLVTTKNGKSEAIVKGDTIPYGKIMRLASTRLAGLPRKDGGKFLKMELKGQELRS